MENKTLRIGGAIIVAALLLRLLGSGFPDRLFHFLAQPEVASVMVFTQTGRVVRFPSAEPEETTPTHVQEAPTAPVQTPVVFTAADATSVSVNSACGYTIDPAALLQAPLDWDLTAQDPTVLILHTHTSESYTGSCDDETTYRTLEETKNMLAVGTRLAELLEQAGIGVIHDRTVHDYPSYNGAYVNSRNQAKDYLAKYPSIRLVLDLHRDAMEDSNGKQIATTVAVGQKQAAQLMMVVGTNAGGLNHPYWKDNAALAVKLHALLERQTPGICRPISLRSQRFNQDLSPGALLIEVGAAGNTQAQALLAAELLGESIISLAHGA